MRLTIAARIIKAEIRQSVKAGGVGQSASSTRSPIGSRAGSRIGSLIGSQDRNMDGKNIMN